MFDILQKYEKLENRYTAAFFTIFRYLDFEVKYLILKEIGIDLPKEIFEEHIEIEIQPQENGDFPDARLNFKDNKGWIEELTFEVKLSGKLNQVQMTKYYDNIKKRFI